MAVIRVGVDIAKSVFQTGDAVPAPQASQESGEFVYGKSRL